MAGSEPPLLRIHWPARLPVADPSAAEVQLLGCRVDGAVPELVVTGTGAASGGTAAAPSVGTLLLQQGPQAAPASSRDHPAFVLRSTRVPGSQLPILLHPGEPAMQHAPPSSRRRSMRLQQQQEPAGLASSAQRDWQCQFILHSSTQGLGSSSNRSSSRGQPVPDRRRLASQLAAHLLGAALALLLLAHRQALTHAASLGGATLAAFATRQLLWLMTAQPAGIKLHRQLCELLSVAGLQYVAGMRWLLAGRAGLLATGGAGLLATALASGGLLRGLAALRCLLWALALPINLPYAAMAAAYRWQLCSTVVMWRVMRGRQRMPAIRQRAVAAARRWLRRSGSSAGGGRQADEPHSPRSTFRLYSAGGSGLKQLSGSMLLFMPLLLLLPTTACFYALALALHTACALPQAAVLLVEQLLRHNPVAAALGQLLHPSSNGGGGGSVEQLQFSLVQVQWAPAALSAAEQRAAQRAIYLRAQPRHGSPMRAAAHAAAEAWAACKFEPTGQVAAKALQGRPLHLAPPRLPR